MYANLRVEVGKPGPDAVETLYAWKVVVHAEGVTVYLDDTETEHKYAEPVGERDVRIDPVHGPREITIGADF